MVAAAGVFSATRYANDFLNLGVDPRASAMGEAVAAADGNPFSLFHNPSALLDAGPRKAALSHSSLFGGLQGYDAAAFTLALDSGHQVAAGLRRSAVDDIWDTRGFETDLDGRPVYSSARLSKVDNADYAFSLAYAAKWGARFRYGAAVKFIRRRFEDLTGYGTGLDAGAQFMPGYGLTAALSGRNLTGTAVRYYENDWEWSLPELTAGLGWKVRADYFYGSIQVLVQSGNMLDQGVSQGYRINREADTAVAPVEASFKSVFTQGSAGLEYLIKNRLALRLGFHPYYHFTAGAGLRVSRICADFSLRRHLDLDDTYQFALGWDFR